MRHRQRGVRCALRGARAVRALARWWRSWDLRFSLPALDEGTADERDHRFAMLVHAGVAHEDDAPAGAAGQRPHLGDLSRVRDRVAHIDRLGPFQIAETGRRPELSNGLAASAQLLVLAPAEIDQQTHPDTGGVPARGAEPAEMRARGLGFVEMKRLRIEARREALDVLGSEGVAPEIADLTDTNVVEELHDSGLARGCAPAGDPASRRPNIGLTIKLIIGCSDASTSSSRSFTNPRSGRLREARVSSTVARALTCAPGRIGASHCTSSIPGAPMKLVSASMPSVSMRMSRQQLCQPEATRPPNKLARAAVSSRCIGCGSYSAAKAMISARVIRRGPHSVTWPGLKSSQCRRGTAILPLAGCRFP